MEELIFEEKKLMVIRASNIRQLIEIANEEKVTKESFITIVPPSVREGEFTLIYFN